MLDAKTPNLWDIQKLNSIDRREVIITAVFKELEHEYSKFSAEVERRFNREYRRQEIKMCLTIFLTTCSRLSGGF